MKQQNNPAASPRKRTTWILLGLIVAAGGLAFWTYTRPEPLAVAVRTVSRGLVERTVANTRAGTVKACRRAKLSPSIGGQIAYLPVKEGDRVKEGDLLLELWNDDLAAQVLLAEREVTATRARAQSVCSRVEAAVNNADRLAALLKSNVGTQERMENAAAEAVSLKAECESVRREVLVREAQLAAARAAFQRTRLLAPFNGVIGEINGERYEYVTPSPLGVPTPPVIDIIESGCFYVIAPIDEVDVAGIRVGMPARITTDAHGSRVFQGRVRRVADYVLDVEKQARTVDVEVGFTHPEDFSQLLAGYSADIEVVIERRDDVVRVPTEAVMTDGSVYVFQPDRAAIERRAIRMGVANWDYTEVIQGLQPEEQVVVNIDAPDLRDGVPAEVIEAAE
ncbi:MAG TPA: efflux RND transporter periplasmic adaptor subunit [Desulfosarcina sp.]|nr:efflux RND transporter periplasmic adaptor subunit [Desulfosarcina sp.]